MKRTSQVKRETKETKITAKVNLDGSGNYKIDTGIGFLDHMIEQLSRHSLIDIELKCTGDLHIDFHHTTEDCAIVLGKAIKDALKDKKGINRYGFAYIPMDETLTRAVIDICDRIYPIFNVKFSNAKIGEMDSELFREFFLAFASALGCNLHIENLYGINNHHIIESCFKACAYALKHAVTIDPRKKNKLASTKESL